MKVILGLTMCAMNMMGVGASYSQGGSSVKTGEITTEDLARTDCKANAHNGAGKLLTNNESITNSEVVRPD